jgi:O-antigen ligase
MAPRLRLLSPYLVAAAVAAFAIADLRLGLDVVGWQERRLRPWPRIAGLAMIWCFAASLGLTLARVHTRRVLPSLLPLGVFLTWGLVAALLGIHPARSVFIWTGYVAAALLISHRPVDAFRGLAIGSGGVVASALLLDLVGWAPRTAPGSYLQHHRGSGRLLGLALEPNMLAHIAGLLVVCAGFQVLAHRRHRTLSFAAIGMGLLAVWESDTRTVILALAASAAVVAWDRSPSAAVAAAAVSIPLIFLSSVDLVDATAPFDRRSDELEDVSGRSFVWAASLEGIVQNPFVGAGLASGPNQFQEISPGSWFTLSGPSSYNLPLEIARETGLIGLALAAWALLAAKPWRCPIARPLLTYLAVTALTMPMSGLPGLMAISWFVVLSLGARANATHSVSRRLECRDLR